MSSIMQRLLLLTVLIIVIVSILSTLTLYGVIPSTYAVVDVRVPLFPDKAVTGFQSIFVYGKGVYKIEYVPAETGVSNITVLLVCSNGSKRTVDVIPGRSFNAILYCDYSLTVLIKAIVDPGTEHIGILKVKKRA